MELVLAEYSLSAPGGTQTYALTLADHLQRLGHGVTMFTLEDGELADHARERGLRVAGREGLPEACDAIVTQDGALAYELAERYPRTPQLFVMHSVQFDFQLPPQLPDTIAAVLVMNDRVARRAAAMGLDAEVVRLTQPIDSQRFRARQYARERPQRAVLLGNTLTGPRRDVMTEALESAGIAWSHLGAAGSGFSYEPERALADADIVIGYGRAVLEGMSAGCAAYVYEIALDGWVTAESYAAIEADGFAGGATGGLAEPERIAADLAAYDASMGVIGRELVVTRHSPFNHATAVAEVLGRLGPRAAAPDPLAAELGRLVRVQWERERRSLGAIAGQHDQLEEFRRRLDAAHVELDARHAELEVRSSHLADAAARMDELFERARAAEGELQRLRGARRHRLVDAMLRPLDALRARLRGRG